MDVIKRSSISAGMMIATLLSSEPEIMSRITKIIPVKADEAILPYIYYRRTDGVEIPVKSGAGADSSFVEITCCAEDYDSAIDLAELTRNALDGASHKDGSFVMRRCIYQKSEDFWEDDAYCVVMTFKVSVQDF